MSTLDSLLQRKTEILAIAARHGAGNVRVFGSVAREDDANNSDIDLLVSMEENRTLYDLIGLKQDMEKLFGRKTDVLSDNAINHHLKDRILGEARPL
jgi:predicted nucleotidyltransferase